MQITRVVYGRSTLPESSILPGGSREVRCPIDFAIFLVCGQGRKILVDSGCETMPGFVMEDFIGPVEALARLGVQAEEITDVIITHAHHDHMASVARFPNARVYLQSLEYEKGKKYLTGDQPVQLFEEALELLPGVKIVKIGGHTKGSCVVEVGNTVLCGDECYSMKNLIHRIPSPSTSCPENSRAFIDRYAQGWITMLCHDPGDRPESRGR